MTPYDPGPNWQLRYWTIFLGQALSLIGSAMMQFVLLWWITDTTGDLSALAMGGMAALLPQALLAPIGGVLADRYSRRLIMIFADMISALSMAVLLGLFLTGAIQLWHIYTAMFVRSAMQAFQGPAAAASVGKLVPSGFLPRAAGLNQTVVGIMTMAATPLGALVLALMPIGWALAIDIIAALLGIAPLLFFAVPQDHRPHEEETSLWREMVEGVQIVWANKGLRRLYALLTGVVMIVAPASTLVLLLVKIRFGGGPTELAILEGMAGAGMICGGILVTALAPRRGMLWAVCGFIVSNLALAMIGLVPSTMFWLAVLFWAVSSAALIAGNAPMMAVLQLTIPNHLQGRVLSLMSMVVGIAAPLGLAVIIPLGEGIGVSWLFILLGLSGALLCGAALFSRPLMALDRQLS